MRATIDRLTLPRLPITIAAALLIAVVVFLALLRVPMSPDWRATFYPAALDWTDPYQGDFHFAYPPWLALILAPFSLIPSPIGRALFGAVSLICLAYALHRLDGDFVALLLLTVSPMFVSVAVNGQVDAWPTLGLALSLLPGLWAQSAGILLLLLKPQVFGLAVIVIWLKSPFKRQILLICAGAGLLSLLAYGWWPGAVAAMIPQLYRAADVSLWPYGLPVGVILFAIALRRQNVLLAALSTYFWAPYFGWYSLTGYLVVALARLPRPVSVLIVLLGWWAVRIWALPPP